MNVWLSFQLLLDEIEVRRYKKRFGLVLDTKPDLAAKAIGALTRNETN